MSDDLPGSFAAAAAIPGEVFRAVENRRTVRCELGGRICYLKLQHPVPWTEILKNLATLRLPVMDTHTEARALQRLAEAGIRAAPVLGYGREGGIRPRSWLVLGELEHHGNVEELLEAGSLDEAKRLRLAEELGDLIGRLHAAGVNHRDLYLCHVLLGLDGHLHLLDLHRAQVRPAVPDRWREKDLAALLYSARELGVTDREVHRFVARYRAHDPAELLNQSSFRSRIVARVERMRARAQRHGTRDFAMRSR